MSFSSDVKKELAGLGGGARHCQIAEMSALLLFCARVTAEADVFHMEILSENEDVTGRCRFLVRKLTGCRIDEPLREEGRRMGRRLYRLLIPDDAARTILELTGALEDGSLREEEERFTDLSVVRKNCCRRAFVRGAFLSAGSVSDPRRSYHLEFVCGRERQAFFLQEILRALGTEVRCMRRKGKNVVYLKEGSQISELLGMAGAGGALLRFENERIVREVRGNVNRQVNCETANIGKTAGASARQIEDIRLIDRMVGLSELPNGLDEMARVRLQYPTAALSELGQYLDPPVGKSGVNHRLRKLSRIADRLRDERGGLV